MYTYERKKWIKQIQRHYKLNKLLELCLQFLKKNIEKHLPDNQIANYEEVEKGRLLW